MNGSKLSMTNPTKRGGLRHPPGGRPKGSTKPDHLKRTRRQWSAYAEDDERMARLIEAGYGKGPSEVIRRLLKEKLEEAKLKG